MGDMGDRFREHKEYDKLRKEKNLESHQDSDIAWNKHTAYHWSIDLAGSRLDFWPSRNKFMWKGKVHTGDVYGFVRKRNT